MSDARLVLMEAIARRRVVEANYNGAVIRLAPHLLFERHDDLFTLALNLSKAWRSDDERSLGQFKLAGLRGMTLIDDPFEPLPGYDQAPPRPGDAVVLAI